jgi:uncharacterized Zn-binding protein involved in type VI secretion
MVQCAHGGQAQPTVTNPRVTVSGQPIVMNAAPYVVAGCGFAPPTGNGPCVSAQWVTSAVRITSNGLPVLLQDSQAVCAPTGTPLVIASTQVRVKGM